MRRLTLLWLVGGASVLAVSLWAILWPRRPEPLFEGKPITAWAIELNSPAADVRNQAALMISRFSSNQIPPLVRMLHTPDPVLARPVAALASRMPNRIGAGLFRIVNPFEARARRAAAAQALRTMGPGAMAALPDLREAMQSDSTVAWHAALALSQLGEPGTEALMAALSEAAPLQRGFACYALGSQGMAASNAVLALANVLRSGETQVVDKAASALANVGTPAVPVLAEALKDPALTVRLLSLDSLGRIGPPARSVLPRVIDLARTDSPPARAAAVDAMARVQGRSDLVFQELMAALRDEARPVRLRALEALGRSGVRRPELVPALIQRLEDESPEIRAQAAAQLGNIDTAREIAMGALRASLRDQNPVVRAQAAEALTRLEKLSTNRPGH